MDTKECSFLITQHVKTEMPYLQFEAAWEELHLWAMAVLMFHDCLQSSLRMLRQYRLQSLSSTHCI
jgi:hypothetical protein